MAATIVSNDGSHTDALEIFSIIWLDANNNINDSRDTQQKLRSIIIQLKLFEDPYKCQQYIEERSKEDRFVLIVGGQMGRIAIPLIHRYPQVTSIYVYCHDTENNRRWASRYPKVRS